jgi:formylglycine-generating enzyme required for sulfatase activity
MSNTSLIKRPSPEQEQIWWLEETYGAATLRLACYAAFALTITPRLLFYLRENGDIFGDRLLTEVPWHGPADLLLSPLCARVGNDLYEMSPALQGALLRQLSDEVADYDGTIDQLERFMLAYIAANLEQNQARSQQVAGEPHWVALALTRPGELADDIREKLRQRQQEKQLGHEFYWIAMIEALQELNEECRQPLAELIVGDRLNLDPGLNPNVWNDFTFDVVQLDARGNEISRIDKKTQYFIEPLGDWPDAPCLEMVAIPGGRFWMGSPEGEGDKDEYPQHLVTVPPFYMSKHQVTQAQWRAVALRDDLKVAKDLEPNPARFKGPDLPVEQVSWAEAQEFCQRVTKLAQRQVDGVTWECRLPSEAMWEYACRGQTNLIDAELAANKKNIPFHFGANISADVANYNGKYAYGQGKKGPYLESTTPVGHFRVANDFGLYDMHGNVYEWCEDFWHDNYEGAPIDGSAWIEGGDRTYVLRGGSWLYNANYCCSAHRRRYRIDYQDSRIGFRVMYAQARTLRP